LIAGREHGDQIFRGKLYKAGHSRAPGTFTLSIVNSGSSQGAIHGYFEIAGGAVYDIVGADSNGEIRSIDVTKQPPCGDGPSFSQKATGAMILDESGTDHDFPVRSLASSVVKLLVVYTTSARVAAGGASNIEATINSMIAYANQAYQNSNIDLELQLVHTEELSTDETGYTFDDILNHITDSDGVWDNAHTLRSAYGADLVSVIVGNFDYCGLAWVMTTNSTSFAPLGFSAVNYTCISSLAHEIGHNMGAQHDIANSSFQGLGPYSYGYRFTGNSSTQYRTVMAYSPGTRISYFSNPNVQFDGVATGVNGSADNALTLNTSRTTVAAFLNDPAQTPTPAPTSSGGGSTATPNPTSTSVPIATSTPTAIPTPTTIVAPIPTPVATQTPAPTATPVDPQPGNTQKLGLSARSVKAGKKVSIAVKFLTNPKPSAQRLDLTLSVVDGNSAVRKASRVRLAYPGRGSLTTTLATKGLAVGSYQYCLAISGKKYAQVTGCANLTIK